VIAGAPLYDAGELNEGAALVFLGSASGVANGTPATAATKLEANQPAARMGSSVAVGDLNNDGYADLIVGARQYHQGQLDEGVAWVWAGSATGIADGSPATAAAALEANQPTAAMGASVAGAGDVDGDGYGDVIVGAPLYDAGQTDEGAAYVFLGNADIHLLPEPGLVLALASAAGLVGALARRRVRR
jgi:hypothetical protein